MAIYGGQVQTTPYQAPDYGPSVAAARELAMTGAQAIPNMISQVGDYFKQQGEKKKLIKKSDVQIDAALKLFPDLAPTLQGVRDQIRDENIPLNDRAAIADSVAGLINMGTNQMRFQAEQGMQQQRLGLERMQYETVASRAQREIDLKAAEQEQKNYAASAEAIGSLAALKSVEEKTGKKFVPDEIASSVNELAQSGQGQAAANLISKYSAGLDPAIKAEFQTKKAQTPVNINLPEGGTQQMVPNAEGVYEPIKIAGAAGVDDAGVLPDMELPLTATTPDGTPLTLNDVPRGAEKSQEVEIGGKKFDVYVDKASPLEPVDILGVFLPGFETAPKEQWTPSKKFLIPKQEEQRQTPTIGPGSIGYAPPKPPSGMTIEQTPGGGFKLVQGAGVGGRFEQAAQERQKQQTSRSVMGVQDAYRALRKFDAEVMKGSGVLASSYRKGAQFLPGTPEHKVAQDLIKPLKDSIAKESLDAMRASSPSGGALGNSSNADIELLRSRYGALEIETDPVVWRQNLTRFIEAQLDVIHGTREQREKLVQEGKLTKDQYFDIESQYPAFTMSATGETVPRQMDGVSPQKQPVDDENARIEAILRQHGVIPK